MTVRLANLAAIVLVATVAACGDDVDSGPVCGVEFHNPENTFYCGVAKEVAWETCNQVNVMVDDLREPYERMLPIWRSSEPLLRAARPAPTMDVYIHGYLNIEGDDPEVVRALAEERATGIAALDELIAELEYQQIDFDGELFENDVTYRLTRPVCTREIMDRMAAIPGMRVDPYDGGLRDHHVLFEALPDGGEVAHVRIVKYGALEWNMFQHDWDVFIAPNGTTRTVDMGGDLAVDAGGSTIDELRDEYATTYPWPPDFD